VGDETASPFIVMATCCEHLTTIDVKEDEEDEEEEVEEEGQDTTKTSQVYLMRGCQGRESSNAAKRSCLVIA
jgi:hypothetical protein